MNKKTPHCAATGAVHAFFPVILAAIAMPSSAGWAAEVFVAPTSDDMSAVLATPNHQSTAERLQLVSSKFLGAPYTLAPLGEGVPPDEDPRVRWDTFDCTTFVETSIALSRSSSIDETISTLDSIRYRGPEQTFIARRHFPAAEWMPDLIEQNFLTDITADVAGKEVRKARKILNPEVWERRRKKILHELPEKRIPNGTFVIDMWPIADALAGYEKIPAGTVLSVVRADFRSIPVRISHQGLVIEKNGKRYLRHAADRVYHRVVDEPLAHFLARNLKYKKWPVKGIHLARVEPANPPTVVNEDTAMKAKPVEPAPMK